MSASIEISPKQALESPALPGLFPPGTGVYITDILPIPPETLVRAATRVAKLGYAPVPHVAARRVTTRQAFEDRLARMTGEAGVSDVLVIGGGPGTSTGEFDSTLALLDTGLFERYGIRRIGVAGHPEGSPDFSDDTGLQLLRAKQAFADRAGVEMRIVTQFGFDPAGLVRWTEALRANAINLPVHIGVSGPAKLPSLVKYAAACGVGNSIDFIRKQAGKLTTLVQGFQPETIAGPVEDHWRQANGPIEQLHVFAFGGLAAASDWLRKRRSWS